MTEGLRGDWQLTKGIVIVYSLKADWLTLMLRAKKLSEWFRADQLSKGSLFISRNTDWLTQMSEAQLTEIVL